MKPEVPVEKEPRPPAPRSPSPPARRRATSRHDDDEEWVESSPRKRTRASRALSPAPSEPPRTVSAPAPAPVPAPVLTSVPTPVPASVPAAVPAPVSTHLDERRRTATNNSRLQMLLFKHKELLKKDIIKKRGLLEKELGIEIQVIVSAFINALLVSMAQCHSNDMSFVRSFIVCV